MNLSNGKRQYLLTGYDAPYMNAGEHMMLYDYDGKPVMNESGNSGSNAENFSVIYRFDINGITGGSKKMVFKFCPYTNPNYFTDKDGGIYVIFDVWQNGNRIKYVDHKYKLLLRPEIYKNSSSEWEIDLSKMRPLDVSQPFKLYVVVSGMSALPLTLSFE